MSSKFDFNIISEYYDSSSIEFYMGKPTKEKEELATQIFDFLEHIDAILGIKNKLQKHELGIIENGV